MPTRSLPERPSLDHLKDQARDLQRAQRAGDSQAAQRIREFHPEFSRRADADIRAARLSLSDAQLAIAREYGFSSWARLKAHVDGPAPARVDGPLHERIRDPLFRQAVTLLDAGDAEGLRRLLSDHPDLVRRRETFEGGNYFRNPTLLEFIAENPIRNGRLPANIVEVARVILDAGASSDQKALDSALELVASGRVPREVGVQPDLIDLLCSHGASPDAAMQAALAHGEFDAAEALLRNGAKGSLAVAAALGRTDDVRRTLAEAQPDERRAALVLAALHGRPEVIAQLLEAGVDPDGYNPVGLHSHSTPLHQAVASGNLEAVRLLVEAGASLDRRDILWQGTPLDWAVDEGRREIEAYLRSAGARTAAEDRAGA